MRGSSWQLAWRRLQAQWAAGPGNQGSVVAAALSLLAALLVCSCGGLSAIAASPSVAAARGAHFVFAAAATPPFGSTEVIRTPTTATPGAPTATVITGATATPTRSATPGATVTATVTGTATKAASPTAVTPTPSPTTTVPTTPAQPTATTTRPAGTPTATPVPAPTPAGPAVLGAPQGAFVAKYGQPTDSSDIGVGRLQFQRYAGTSIDFLVVQLDIYDDPSVRDRAYSITAQHPPDHFWSMSEAQGICEAFLPADARFQQSITVPGSGGADGVDHVYLSPSLASIFPAATFVDAAQHRVPPGTFDLRYVYASPGNNGQIQYCELELGRQQAPAAVTGNG